MCGTHLFTCASRHCLEAPKSVYSSKVFLFRITEPSMKYWKVYAIIALAAIPLLLISKKEKGLRPISGDPDDIFEQELSID